MGNRTSTEYNEILGRDKYGEVIVLGDVFEYENGSKGATGTQFEIIKADDVQRRLEGFEEYMEDTWRHLVYEGSTTEGLSEWVENSFSDDDEKIEYMFDQSYSELHDDIREAFDLAEDDVINCTGGGRMFPEALDGLEWMPGKREKFESIIRKAEGE